ncbi:hypothetical protein PPL19_12638 [Pseudomonas psychrotolerans L19]|nr:hypothetical protein PPL19_12638 [Pseudomonas psychrotolerans L19]
MELLRINHLFKQSIDLVQQLTRLMGPRLVEGYGFQRLLLDTHSAGQKAQR